MKFWDIRNFNIKKIKCNNKTCSKEKEKALKKTKEEMEQIESSKIVNAKFNPTLLIITLSVTDLNKSF